MTMIRLSSTIATSRSDDLDAGLVWIGNPEPCRVVGRHTRPNGIHHPGHPGRLFSFGATMKEIELSKGKIAIVDEEDFDHINQWKWSYATAGYAVRRINGIKYVLMHREILECTDGKQHVDHINGNRLDNRRSNLRWATPQQNLFNQKRNCKNTSGFKGVTWSKSKNKFVAQIHHNSKGIFLGHFTDPKDAHEAYCEAAKRLFGEFARFE